MSNDILMTSAVQRLESIASTICAKEEIADPTNEALALGAYITAKTIYDLAKSATAVMDKLPMAASVGLSTPPIVETPDDVPDLSDNPLAGGALSKKEIEDYLQKGEE